MKKHISKSLAAAFLSLFGLSSNVAGMENNPKPKVDYKITGIKYLNDKEDSTSKVGGQAITYNLPLNILVINGLDKVNNDFEAKSLVALLCRNKLGLKVSEIDNVGNYQKGKAYHLENLKKVRVAFFNVDDFIGKNYLCEKAKEHISKNANVIFYLYGKRKNNDCDDKLKDFYHELNYWWCKGHYDYDKNNPEKSYNRYNNKDGWVIATNKSKGLKYEDIRRYIYFLNYGTKDEGNRFLTCNCPTEFSKGFEHLVGFSHQPGCKQPIQEFVSGMPDSRSIMTGLFYKNASINKISDIAFGEMVNVYGTPKELFTNDSLQGKWYLFDNNEGTGFEKKNVQSGWSWG